MRLCGISDRFQSLSPCMRQVTHALLTRPPLASVSSLVRRPQIQQGSFDLHVLSTPPAFILSQDQTLMLKVCPKNKIKLSFSFPWFFLIYCLRLTWLNSLEFSEIVSKNLFLNLSRLHHYLVINVLRCFWAATRLIYHGCKPLSTTFFIFFNLFFYLFF